MKIAKNSRLVMIGDSITDAGRAQPYGEGKFASLGGGYVSLVDAFLAAGCPERGIRVFNTGTSGNTVRDLKTRWDRDVLALRPDWVSVMIGTNDVWRQFDSPLQTEIHVLPEEYETTLDELAGQTLPAVKGMALLTPFYLEANRKDPMRARMDEYGAIVKKVAKRRGALFVDTQTAFAPVLEATRFGYVNWDRVHPNLAGHLILARAFLDAVGFKW